MKAAALAQLKDFLDLKVGLYNRPGFIDSDPISIPHLFRKRQDIEIAGLFAAVLAWGQRKTIIRNCLSLMDLMDHAPYDFVVHHQPGDLKKFATFKHRTFNGIDLRYFLRFLGWYFTTHDSLENAFLSGGTKDHVGAGLSHFHDLFFSLPDHPRRTRKHISTPDRKSACKRMNMFLRWMVRRDEQGVDFGLWKGIMPAHLICPCDVHVLRVARKLKLIRRKQSDWAAAVELTVNLRQLDPDDPVKYDFALFGLGVEEKF